MGEYEEEVEYFQCSCCETDHLLVVHFIKHEDGTPELVIRKSMSHYLPWYKRVYQGVRYIFGMRHSKYHFEEMTILNQVDIERLYQLVKECRDYRNRKIVICP
jgi:hypothetical protein